MDWRDDIFDYICKFKSQEGWQVGDRSIDRSSGAAIFIFFNRSNNSNRIKSASGRILLNEDNILHF